MPAAALCVCVCVSYTCWVTEKKSRRAGRTSARDARESKRKGGGGEGKWEGGSAKRSEPASPLDGR